VPTKTETGTGAKKSLDLHFDIPADFTSQGDQLESQGRHADAVRLYQEAVKDDPKNIQAWWNMGNVYCKMNQRKPAIQCFDKVLELRPDFAALKAWLDKFKAKTP
jgi:tetratricopeptide (TPR) repeat protein